MTNKIKNLFTNKQILAVFLVLIISLIVLTSSISGGHEGKESMRENNSKEDSLKKKIGQMIILGFDGTEINDDSYITKVIKELNIGGVILFDYFVESQGTPRNITGPEQTKKLISDLKSYSKTQMLIAIDAEGGYVNRLKEKYGFLPILSAQVMGEDATTKTTQAETEKIASQLKDLGFNMNFGPVLDVNVNPENPVIGYLERSFSANPSEVTNHAKAFIEEHNKKNIITVAKHFPGHGSSDADSHLGLTDVTNSYQEEELIPYINLQNEGLLDVVMTAHIMNTNIDPEYPATLSPNFLKKILREDIGFEGVIVSDDMHMKAIADNYGFEEAVIRAVNAGCNLLILSNNGDVYDEELAYRTVDTIYKAIEEGKISIDDINKSYELIMNLKKKFDIVS